MAGFGVPFFLDPVLLLAAAGVISGLVLILVGERWVKWPYLTAWLVASAFIGAAVALHQSDNGAMPFTALFWGVAASAGVGVVMAASKIEWMVWSRIIDAGYRERARQDPRYRPKDFEA